MSSASLLTQQATNCKREATYETSEYKWLQTRLVLCLLKDRIGSFNLRVETFQSDMHNEIKAVLYVHAGASLRFLRFVTDTDRFCIHKSWTNMLLLFVDRKEANHRIASHALP